MKKRVMLSQMPQTPPKEFRIFRSGVNRTEKGDFTFDAKSARDIMEAFKKRGVDGQIDLEHLSNDDEHPNYDPDARGAYQLEMRGGDLWAVDVSWTPDGERRIREKRQRYISPTFYVDKNKRITGLHNIAICANPATHNIAPLIAASKKSGLTIAALAVEVSKMEELKKIAAQLGLGEDATLEDILAAIDALKAEESKDEPPKEEKEETTDDPEEKEMAKLSSKAQARIVALTASHDSMKKEIVELKASNQRSEVDALIAANVDKIPLKLEGWARKQKPEDLREYLSHAVPGQRKASTQVQAKDDEVTLSEGDLIALSMVNGITKEKFIEQKKKLAKK